MQLCMRVFLYDKIKNSFMPYDSHKYKGFDYFWRAASSFALITGLTTLVVYPFDLVHTRMSADITSKGQQRLFTTTFDCFNRTHLDEGRAGLYKGYQLAILSSVLRASLTLPVYDTMRTTLPTDGWLANFSQRLGASFASSMAMSLLLYPLDTMKRCQQLNGGRGQLMLYRGLLDGFQKLHSQQGFGAFYRGVSLFFVKEVICAFAQVSVYEALSPAQFGL